MSTEQTERERVRAAQVMDAHGNRCATCGKSSDEDKRLGITWGEIRLPKKPRRFLGLVGLDLNVMVQATRLICTRCRTQESKNRKYGEDYHGRGKGYYTMNCRCDRCVAWMRTNNKQRQIKKFSEPGIATASNMRRLRGGAIKLHKA